MMGTEIFNIDPSWAQKLTKTRVPFLSAPTVGAFSVTVKTDCETDGSYADYL